MQGFRTRVDTIFRRPSFGSAKDADQSGTESENVNVNVSGQSPNRASTDKDKDSLRRGSYDSGSIKARARKRLSLSFRGRRGTGDAAEHSQIAQQVVGEINAEEAKKLLHVRDDEEDVKPAAGVVTATTAAAVGAEQCDSAEGTKVDSSPVDLDAKDDKKPLEEDASPIDVQEPTPEVNAPEPVVEEPKVDIPTIVEPVEQQITTHEVDTTAPSTDAWATQSRVGGLGESYHVVMHGSPVRAPVAITVEEPAPSFPEPVQYDTSFASSTSGTDNYSAPTPLAMSTNGTDNYSAPAPLSMSMPVPRPTGAPLSAIDELHAKTYSMPEQEVTRQVKEEALPLKEDPNYDADEEESKPLLDSSILMEASMTLPQRPIDSTLSLHTDVKGKGRDATPVYEALGWTEYILPDTTYYFALHMSSPASQNLKMPTPLNAFPTPTVTVIADYDLRNDGILKRVCEEMRALIRMELPLAMPNNNNYNTSAMLNSSIPGDADAGGWELWLHRPLGYIPTKIDAVRPPIVHTWVHHSRRLLAPRPHGLAPREDGDAVTLVNGNPSAKVAKGTAELADRGRLAQELAYWAFVERHPAHGDLGEAPRREALESLTWSFADRLVQGSSPIPAPFSQEECQSLLRLLDTQSALSISQDRLVVNRVIASVHSRLLQHKIAVLDAKAAVAKLSDDLVGKKKSSIAFPIRRAAFGFLSAIVCWGIPYLFLENPSADHDPLARFRPYDGNHIRHGQNGLQMHYSLAAHDQSAERETGAMLYGAGVGVTAAVVIGSATTVLTMRPALDTPARTASFVALICAGASLAASLISLARMARISPHSSGSNYNLYNTNPPSSQLFYPGAQRDAESLVVLNVKSLWRAVPLVLLAYAIVALFVAVFLHNFGHLKM